MLLPYLWTSVTHSLALIVCMCVAGLSMAVCHESLYSGLSGFNGALGCMAVGGFFIFSLWTHLFAIASGNTNTQTHTGTVIICCLKYLMAVKWCCSYITNDVRWHLSTNLFWGMLFSSHCVYSNVHNSYQTSTLGIRNVMQEIWQMEYVELPAVVTPFK